LAQHFKGSPDEVKDKRRGLGGVLDHRLAGLRQ